MSLPERPAWFGAKCASCGWEVATSGAETGQRLLTTALGTVPVPVTQIRYPVVRHVADTGSPRTHVLMSVGQDGYPRRIHVTESVPQTPGEPPSIALASTVLSSAMAWSACAGWTPDGFAAWQASPHTYAVETQTPGAPPTTSPIPFEDGSVLGFIGDPAQAKSWLGYSSKYPLVVHGVTLMNPVYNGPWVSAFHPTENVFLLWHVPTDTLYRGGNTYATQCQHQLIVFQDQPIICRNYPNGYVTLDQMTPVDATPAPAPTPPPTPPARRWAEPAYGRKIQISPFFSYSEKYGDTPDPLGNVITLVADETTPAALGQTIARLSSGRGAETLRFMWTGLDPGFVVGPLVRRVGVLRCDWAPTPAQADRVVAWWAGAGSLAELQRMIAWLQTFPERRIRAYLDGDDWPEARPAWWTDDVIPEIQVYRAPGESLSDLSRRVGRVLDRVEGWGTPALGVCLRWDTARVSPETLLAEDVACYRTLLRTRERIQYVHLFSDRREGAGLVALASSPILREAARAICLAVPAGLNRYDAWRPRILGPRETLQNKLRQDVGLFDLDATERGALLAALAAHR